MSSLVMTEAKPHDISGLINLFKNTTKRLTDAEIASIIDSLDERTAGMAKVLRQICFDERVTTLEKPSKIQAWKAVLAFRLAATQYLLDEGRINYEDLPIEDIPIGGMAKKAITYIGNHYQLEKIGDFTPIHICAMINLPIKRCHKERALDFLALNNQDLKILAQAIQ